MSQKIEWLTDWDQALERAAGQDRPVLVDFFLPG